MCDISFTAKKQVKRDSKCYFKTYTECTPMLLGDPGGYVL